MKVIILSLLIVHAFGFMYQPDNKKIAVGQEFKLRPGQRAILRVEGLTIEFGSVAEDSRCPIGVDCIWQGNAKVLLKMHRKGKDARTLELNTTLEPRSASFPGYVVEMVQLEPYPKANASTKKEDYVVTLIVRKQS